MLKKIDHIGIAVTRLSDSIPVFEKMGLKLEGTEEVADQKVKTAFFNIGGVHIELLEPTSPDSPIAGFLEKKGQGIHHIAFESDQIEAEMEHLKTEGLEFIDRQPRDGAHQTRIAFLHPKSTARVLTEICQHRSEN